MQRDRLRSTSSVDSSQLRTGEANRFHQAVPQSGYRHSVQIAQTRKAGAVQFSQSTLPRDLGKSLAGDVPLVFINGVPLVVDLHVRGSVHR